MAAPRTKPPATRDVRVAGHRLEYQWLHSANSQAPTLVFLHEGLGSIALWKDFPARMAAASGCHALVYSRYGNGSSELLSAPRTTDYMHREGLEVLPELLEKLNVREPILFGHSDGASISLLYAGTAPPALKGLIVCAPHIFVEDLTIESIAAARVNYETTNLKRKLTRYHADVERTFRGWNDIWLNPAFRSWNIESCLPRTTCPILAIQGYDDEYGTMDQVDQIAAQTQRTTLSKLANCGHSPHRDQPEAVLRSAADFIVTLGTEARDDSSKVNWA